MPNIPTSAIGARITGWGRALPPKVLTNSDLEAMMDTSDAWIRERTGIEKRHVGGTTSGLSIESGRLALEMAGVDPTEIDALVLSTTTPDRTVPATSATVQNALGLKCGAFDVNAACSGFVYATVVAHGLIAMGSKKVLLIGTDTLARITDWNDRNTAILFADGSGAAVLEATDGPGQLLAWDLDADGSAEELLYCEIGGTIHMDGKEVFRRAVRIMVDSARKSMASGEHSHHLRGMRPPRSADGARRCVHQRNGQHIFGVNPPRTLRCSRQGSTVARRSRSSRRIRCRHDRRERDHPVGCLTCRVSFL
jgi:3-oxoacyl-[acyl-carrier-protein] synthase-3